MNTITFQKNIESDRQLLLLFDNKAIPPAFSGIFNGPGYRKRDKYARKQSPIEKVINLLVPGKSNSYVSHLTNPYRSHDPWDPHPILSTALLLL